MKKSTIFLLILDILIIVFGVYMYQQIIRISTVQTDGTLSTANGIFEINSKISELEAEIEKLKNDKEQENPTVDTIKFDSSKMKSNSKNVKYEEYKSDLGSSGLEIEIKDGKAYLSTDVEDDQYKLLFPEITKEVKNQEITGFKSDVKDVYYAFIGNGDMQPIILFLMKDGTVEYADSGKMLESKKYVSSGKIKELINIVKFVNLNLQDIGENGEALGGIMTVGAIDEDGYTYDLSACDAIKNINK